MLDGIVDEGACEFVWLSVIGSWMEQNKTRGPVGERTNTCGLQQVSVPSIVARPVCLAHCAHPPTDGRKEIGGENSTAGRSQQSQGEDEEQRSCKQLGKGSIDACGKWEMGNGN
jgi:hypothetical protein